MTDVCVCVAGMPPYRVGGFGAGVGEVCGLCSSVLKELMEVAIV